ncbi:retrovirus-related Pol polyprotein from transposon 17.6 [Trichonephila clavipes]|nr:retrovirus-related Pol polyprotein from transposon 17.6 [Trichonephila clavipes]
MKIITVNNYEDFSSDFPVSQDILPPLTEKDFKLSGLDSKIKSRLFQLLISHKSAFARSTVELSAAATEHHRISLQHVYPIKCPIYKIPFNLRNEFRRQITDLEKAGIISKSNSQNNTPALFVKQKEKWRLVLDFRKLNEITLTQDFVIPTLDDILHEISGSNYFSALDMKSAFNQIPLHFADRHKTSFSTPEAEAHGNKITPIKSSIERANLVRRRFLEIWKRLLSCGHHGQVWTEPLQDSNSTGIRTAFIVKSCGGYSGDVYDLHLIHEELCDCHTIDINATRTFVNQYQKNLGIFKVDFSCAIFARVWLKDLSRSVYNSTNELQQRFKKKIEKYNPKQEFLSISSFRKFENAFSLQREEDDGWSHKGIKHLIQGYNETRSEFLVSLIKETKSLKTARELVRESQLLVESECFNANEINEEA